jgi:ubiquinol-cytochrome c reductase cytochrome c1 subunit
MRAERILGIALMLTVFSIAPIQAQEHVELPRIAWSFSGPFDRFDREALRRGYEVFSQSCQFCHGLTYVAYHNLAALEYTEQEIIDIAAKREVIDGPNDKGEMFKRAARISDRMPLPFMNAQAARMANNGALPPDLSLIVKARAGGADYIFGVLTGYADAPGDVTVQPGLYYNQFFPGHQIAMPPPLRKDGVTYSDGTEATVEQQAYDVVTFLAWAAEPMLEERKRIGTQVILFLIGFAALVFAIKQRVWARLH